VQSSSVETFATTSFGIPLNANSINRMMSYPMGRSRCLNRQSIFRLPSLSRLYEACDTAKVRCQHVYLHRNPYDVLHSTTFKRRFNPTLYAALHTYTSMLELIYAQMAAYPNRMMGCLDFFENEFEASRVSSGWGSWTTVLGLGGWTVANRAEFDSHVRSAYRPPRSFTDDERRKMVSEDVYGPYIRSMVRAHANIVQKLCPSPTNAQEPS